MAKNETIRVRPSVLQADLDALTALQSFGDYDPANPVHSKAAVLEQLAAMKSGQASEFNAQNALAAARDSATAAEWNFHNLMLIVKDQVIAQYGKDSDQVQALGLKKKSERKAPTRVKKVSA